MYKILLKSTYLIPVFLIGYAVTQPWGFVDEHFPCENYQLYQAAKKSYDNYTTKYNEQPTTFSFLPANMASSIGKKDYPLYYNKERKALYCRFSSLPLGHKKRSIIDVFFPSSSFPGSMLIGDMKLKES